MRGRWKGALSKAEAPPVQLHLLVKYRRITHATPRAVQLYLAPRPSKVPLFNAHAFFSGLVYWGCSATASYALDHKKTISKRAASCLNFPTLGWLQVNVPFWPARVSVRKRVPLHKKTIIAMWETEHDYHRHNFIKCTSGCDNTVSVAMTLFVVSTFEVFKIAIAIIHIVSLHSC